MSREQVLVGIDIGTHYVYTVVGVMSPEHALPHITGIGKARSAGIRKGMIVDMHDATASIKRSIQEASSASGINISSAMVSVGGNHIVSLPSRGTIAVSRADREIAEDDLVRVSEAARTVSLPPNKEILHNIPNGYIVDGEAGLNDVLGMHGLRLEVDSLIVGVASSHISKVGHCLSECGIEADGFVLSVLVASQSVLSNKQKEIGTAVVDIGAGTTDIAVFEEGAMTYTDVLPLGGEKVTADLAMGLRTKFEVAESIKCEYGMATMEEPQTQKRDNINISEFDNKEKGVFTRKNIVDIMEPRLKEILGEVNKKFHEAKKEKRLPGGVVLVGGTAKTPHLVDLCKKELKLPCTIGFPREVESVLGSVEDPALASAVGLIFWQLEDEQKGVSYTPKSPISFMSKELPGKLGKIQKWLKVFVP